MAKLQYEMDRSRWLCVSCHDWACLCKAPYTVRKYSFGHTPAAPVVNPTVYERTYMSSFPDTWANNKKTPEQLLTESSMASAPKSGVLRQRRKQTGSKALRKSTKGKALTGNDGSSAELDVIPYEYYFDSLTKSPITARKPFLVSSPHWASTTRSHTQQWPWRSGSQCRLWSAASHFDLARTHKHKACWKDCKQWTYIAFWARLKRRNNNMFRENTQ